MPRSITPVLSSSAGYEDDMPTQIAILLRWFIMNPGATSDIWESKLISFRKMAGAFEHERLALASEAKTSIKLLLENKFKDYFFDVEVTPKDYDETKDGRYRLVFAIHYTDRNTGSTDNALISGNIRVNPTSGVLDIIFDKSV